MCRCDLSVCEKIHKIVAEESKKGAYHCDHW